MLYLVGAALFLGLMIYFTRDSPKTVLRRSPIIVSWVVLGLYTPIDLKETRFGLWLRRLASTTARHVADAYGRTEDLNVHFEAWVAGVEPAWVEGGRLFVDAHLP